MHDPESWRSEPRAADPTGHAIELAAAGDREGLRYLYARYAPAVQAYVRRLLPNDYDAEDVTQQVFLKLITRLYRYDASRARFSAWILRVARNTAIDYLRQNRPLLVGEPLEPRLESDADADDRRRSLCQALQNLTSDQRDVFVLRDMMGLRPSEAAQCLGKTPGAVNTCHHRARLAARDTLESMGYAPLTQAGRT
jgi:RNA polymerase sigma-70 factor, ECF subfamily